MRATAALSVLLAAALAGPGRAVRDGETSLRYDATTRRVVARRRGDDADTQQADEEDQDCWLCNQADPSLDDICIPENGPDAFLRMRRRFARDWDPVFQQTFAAIDEPVMMTLGEFREVMHLRNFIKHSDRVTQVDDSPMVLMHVSVDQATAAECLLLRMQLVSANSRLRLHCLDLSGWLPSALLQDDDLSLVSGNGNFGSCKYRMLSACRPITLLSAAKAARHGVLMIDLDVVIHRNILAYFLAEENKNYWLSTGTEGKGDNSNLGTVWATRSSVPIIELWVNSVGMGMGNFTVCQTAFRLNVKPKFHDRIHLVPNYVIGECAKQGIIATHYNCVADKVAVMKDAGDW